MSAPKPVTPSADQKKIYDFIQNGSGSAVIVAVAGSGKTTTIVEAAKLLHPSVKATFVAFGKAIATELSTRLPSHVRAQTLNAMGFGAWARVCGRLTVDGMKTLKIMDQVVPPEERPLYKSALPRLVGLAKSAGIVPRGCEGRGLMQDDDWNWNEMIELHDLQVEDKGTTQRLVELARAVLRESIACADKVIDFDDQLYMPVIRRCSFFKNDILFVDEAQDVNMIQRAMMRMALKADGRLIAVGDPYQAIYGFRGADHDAIELIKDMFSAVELPLSISWRCPRKVVELAREYVPHIRTHDKAAEGEVLEPNEFKLSDFRPNDVVVCRCTAPAVALAYKMIRSKIRCFVMGREIGQGLISVVDKMKADGVDDLQAKLDAYRARETARLTEAKQDSKADALNDKVDTIEVFIDGLGEDDRSVGALKNAISSLFSDNDQTNAVKLMTQHKSKGLEADNVFILDFSLNERFMGKKHALVHQERNLVYVAITRARRRLTFVDSEMFDAA